MILEGASEDFAVAIGGSDAGYAAASNVGAPSQCGWLEGSEKLQATM